LKFAARAYQPAAGLDEEFGHDVAAFPASFAGLAYDVFGSVVFGGAGDFVLPALHFYMYTIPVNHFVSPVSTQVTAGGGEIGRDGAE
jgi:hypothetical protein